MNYARRLDRRAALRNKRRLAVKDQVRRGLLAERLEDRSLMAGDLSSFFASTRSEYWNPVTPADVDNNGTVAAADALVIINQLNSYGPHALPKSTGGEGEASAARNYLDVNNDWMLSAADALTVINAINSEGAPGDPIINVTMLAMQPGTNTPLPGNTIQAGQDFDLVVVATDLRSDNGGAEANRGVFQLGFDLLYEKELSKVRVAEVQVVTVAGNGSFKLTIDGQTTDAIPFNTANPNNRAIIAASIQNALNAKLGANKVFVSPTQATGAFIYSVWFVGEFDVDKAKMVVSDVTAGNASVKDAAGNVPLTFQAVDGDPTNPVSFAEGFRGRALPTGDPMPPYQGGINAVDASGPERVDDLSFFAGLDPLGTFPAEFSRVRMKAQLPAGVNEDVQTFTLDFVNVDSGKFTNQVYANSLAGESKDVPISQITFNSLAITINSGPLRASPIAASVQEGASTTIDVLVDGQVAKNPGAPNGAIELRSVSQPSVGGGSVAIVNGKVVYTPGAGAAADFSGPTTFTYTAGINGVAGAENTTTQTVNLTVNPVNDAPTITAPNSANIAENATLTFSGANAISINDVDVGAGDLTLTLAAAQSNITLASTTGLTVTGDGTANVTATGSLANLNAALNGLTYVRAGERGGNFGLQVTVNDLGGTVQGGAAQQTSRTVAINVSDDNDAPTITAPGSASVSFVAGETLTFNGANAITVADVDAANSPIKVTLTVNGGVGNLSATGTGGATVGGTPTALTITGSQSAVTSTLATLTLDPPDNQIVTGTIVATVDDQGNTPAPAKTATATINISVVPPNKPFALSDNFTADSGVYAAGLEGAATYTLDVLANDLTNGTSTPTIVSFTQPSVGTISQVNGKLVYTPTSSDFFTPTAAQFVTFTYVINETPSTGEADSPPATVTLKIKNDADTPVGVADNYGTSTAEASLVISNPAEGVLQRGVDDSVVDNNFGVSNYAALTVVNPGPRTTSGGGTVNIAANGTFTYTRASGFIGNDSTLR